jgi:hypothetical protein
VFRSICYWVRQARALSACSSGKVAEPRSREAALPAGGSGLRTATADAAAAFGLTTCLTEGSSAWSAWILVATRWHDKAASPRLCNRFAHPGSEPRPRDSSGGLRV